VTLMLEDVSFRSYDFAEKGLDLALRISSMRNASVIEQHIAPLEWVACASPDYLARKGRPKHPSDLAKHDCLVHINVTANDRIWRFEGPKGNISAKVGGSFFSNSALALRKAALSDLGIALLPRYTVTDELDSGALVAVLPRYKSPSRPLIAVHPRVPVVPTKVEVFVDFLIKWFAARDVSRTPQRHA
jgi:DNA-binding transcriptional LysR family regulator